MVKNSLMARCAAVLGSALLPLTLVHAQCVPVSLPAFPTPAFELMPDNRTLCQFGGNYMGIDGLVSCLHSSVEITPNPQNPTTNGNRGFFESILANAVAKHFMSVTDISYISSSVDYAIIARETPTPNVFEWMHMNKAAMLTYVGPAGVANYVPVSNNLNFTSFSSITGVRRTQFTPRNRSPLSAPDVSMTVDVHNNFIGYAGYDPLNSANQFMIYRINSPQPGHAFDPFQVCRGAAVAPLFTNVFHQNALIAGGLTTPLNQRFIPY